MSDCSRRQGDSSEGTSQDNSQPPAGVTNKSSISPNISLTTTLARTRMPNRINPERECARRKVMSALKKCLVLLVLVVGLSAASANPRYVSGYGNRNHGYYGPWYYKDYYKYNYYYRPTPDADYQ